MTTGNRTIGFLVRTPTDSGVALIGTRIQRSWTGTDSPIVKGRMAFRENEYHVSYSLYSDRVLRYSYPQSPGIVYTGSMGVCGWTPGDKPFSITSNDEIALLNRLMGKIRGHSFNAGITLAEGKETLTMLQESMHTVLSAYISLRHGNVKKFSSILRSGTRVRKFRVRPSAFRTLYSAKSFEEKWLSLRYGWLPFVHDAFEFAHALESMFSRKDNEPLQVRAAVKKADSFVWGATTPQSRSAYDHRLQLIAKFTVDKSLIKSLKDLGLMDPASVAWEVLPYSFVVDWFLPIGSYLSARNSKYLLASTQLIRTKYAHQKLLSLYNALSGRNYPILSDASGLQSETMSMERVINPSIQTPLPEFRNPLAGPIAHFVDAYALLRQRAR